ncbi:hypothetical protein CyaNS01_01204 [Cyanobium sp. NS01]|nr:hypothetical protein CyaNS01_01204 [Cyanobium sp. NS01]
MIPIKGSPRAPKLSNQKTKFSQNGPLNPTWVATAKGGRMKARMMRKMSPTVMEISCGDD